MKLFVIPVTPFEQNCSLIWCEQTNRGAVVDPGGDIDRITDAIREQNIKVEKILLTHGHIDHAGAAEALAKELNVPIEGPQIEERFWIDRLPQQSIMFGFPQVNAFVPDRWLDDGDEVSVGNLRLSVKHCPGHTPGHIIFFEPKSRLAFVGDVLFRGAIGRTDFPRGNHEMLIRSIRNKLWPNVNFWRRASVESFCRGRCLIAADLLEFVLAGLPALQDGESGQVRKEAATAVFCKCRG
jgi:hydroxyacylglutathione hydrolase